MEKKVINLLNSLSNFCLIFIIWVKKYLLFMNIVLYVIYYRVVDYN